MSNRRVPPPSNICRLATPLTARTVPWSVASGSASTLTFDGLARVDVGAIVLGQLGRDLDARGVDQIGDQLTRVGGIADAILRHGAAEEDAAERHHVRPQRDEAIERRAHAAGCRCCAGDLDGDARLVALSRCSTAPDADGVASWLLTSTSSCASRCRASSSSSRFCLATSAADELVGGGVELGAPDLEARLEQRDFVFRGLHGGFGLGLGDLLLGELQIELRLLEGELLLGRIEFRR